jgi:alanine racemase
MLIEQEKESGLLDLSQQRQTVSSWVEIDKNALEHNLESYKKIISPAFLAPVIKSNAYGHGIGTIAKILDSHKDVDYICVVALQEALFLRSIGIQKPLLVLSIIDGDLEEAVDNAIDLVAYDIFTVKELNAIARIKNKKASVHIKIDTGLSRLGLGYTQALQLVKDTHELSHISIQGIFTHLAESESDDQTFTNQQREVYSAFVKQVETLGIFIPLKHIACSAAATINMSNNDTMVRLGIGMYGLWPSEENKSLTQKLYPNFYLKPVLSWKTRIIQIKEIPAGSSVGYDRTHCVSGPTKIAIIPVGYWDGYDRRLSNKGIVLINNQEAPIIGRIAMNLSIVDITGLSVSKDHEVILLGNYPNVSADDLAKKCNTINYEIVTRINPLLPRRIT